MSRLYLQYSLQLPESFEIFNSQGLHLSVTTASSLILKRPLLYRRSGSSRSFIQNLENSATPARGRGLKKVKKHFFEPAKMALQTLQTHFEFNKSKSGKGFKLVTPPKKAPDSVTSCNKCRYKM